MTQIVSHKRFISDKLLKDETDSSDNAEFRGFVQGAVIQGVGSHPSHLSQKLRRTCHRYQDLAGFNRKTEYLRSEKIN